MASLVSRVMWPGCARSLYCTFPFLFSYFFLGVVFLFCFAVCLFVCLLRCEIGLTRQVIIRHALPRWALYSRYEKKVQMSKLIDHLIGVKTAWPNPTELPVRKGLLAPSPVPRDSTQLDS